MYLKDRLVKPSNEKRHELKTLIVEKYGSMAEFAVCKNISYPGLINTLRGIANNRSVLRVLEKEFGKFDGHK